MPGGDGIEIAHEIRRSNEIPIIICTGFRDQVPDRLRCLGGISILRKPFATAELIDLVEIELMLAEPALPRTE